MFSINNLIKTLLVDILGIYYISELGGFVGRPKRELKKIHRKKTKKAREEAKKCSKGEIPYEKLTQRAKHFLKKGKKQKTTSA